MWAFAPFLLVLLSFVAFWVTLVLLPILVGFLVSFLLHALTKRHETMSLSFSVSHLSSSCFSVSRSTSLRSWLWLCLHSSFR